MKLRKFSTAKVATIVIMVVAAVLVAGCGSLGSDQNTFSPSGEVAQKQLDLFIIVLIPAVIILIGVFAVMLYIFIRFRRREGDGIPKQIEGNNRLEIGSSIVNCSSKSCYSASYENNIFHNYTNLCLFLKFILNSCIEKIK